MKVIKMIEMEIKFYHILIMKRNCASWNFLPHDEINFLKKLMFGLMVTFQLTCVEADDDDDDDDDEILRNNGHCSSLYLNLVQMKILITKSSHRRICADEENFLGKPC